MYVSDLEVAVCGHGLFCRCGVPSTSVSKQSPVPLKPFVRSGLQFMKEFNTILAENHAVKNSILRVKTWVAFQEYVERSALH